MTNTNEDRAKELLLRRLNAVMQIFVADMEAHGKPAEAAKVAEYFAELLSDKQALERERDELRQDMGVFITGMIARGFIDVPPLDLIDALVASLTAAQERVGELEKENARLVRGVQGIAEPEYGIGFRRLVARAKRVLRETPRSLEGPGIGGGS